MSPHAKAQAKAKALASSLVLVLVLVLTLPSLSLVLDHRNVDQLRVKPCLWKATSGACFHATLVFYVGLACGRNLHVGPSGCVSTWWSDGTTRMSIGDVVGGFVRVRGRYLGAVGSQSLKRVGALVVFGRLTFELWHPTMTG